MGVGFTHYYLVQGFVVDAQMQASIMLLFE